MAACQKILLAFFWQGRVCNTVDGHSFSNINSLSTGPSKEQV